MDNVAQLISTLGFPIVACIGLAWFCKNLIDNNNKHIEQMFTMYEKANDENRKAIENCTRAIDRLCDNLDDKGV